MCYRLREFFGMGVTSGEEINARLRLKLKCYRSSGVGVTYKM